MDERQKVLVIIPAYNEEGSLQNVIKEVRRHLPDGGVLVVNDGSTDLTGDVAKAGGVYVLEHPYNMGIGATMQTGFLFASRNGYDFAIQVDGDGQHDPSYIKELISPVLRGEANMVIGSRYLQEKGFKSSVARRIGIRFFSILYRVLAGGKVTDPTSGFRVIDRKVIHFFSTRISTGLS